jgi:hypothetical protein
MHTENPTQRVLRSAVDAVGGADQLAAALGVARTELESWMAGNGTPPQDILLNALELATYQAQLKDLPPEQRRQ